MPDILLTAGNSSANRKVGRVVYCGCLLNILTHVTKVRILYFPLKTKITNKMNKLELKHIVGYLPYDLKSTQIFDGIRLYHNVTLFNAINFVEGNTSCKIILRPISDLTKPCLPDGKILILELAKIAYPKAIKYTHIKGKICFIDSGEKYVFGYVSIEQSFICTQLPENRNCFVNNQLKLFEKLFEWNFDVFGLIEKGLAIDINTLK